MVEKGVQLPTPSASKVVYQIIEESCTNFPQAFQNYQKAENVKQFAAKYKDYLSQFEICRSFSSDRGKIASFVLDEIYRKFLFVANDSSTSLQEYMQCKKNALSLDTVSYPWCKEKRNDFQLSYDGKIYDSKESLVSLSQLLFEKGICNQEASHAISWLAESLFCEDEDVIAQQKFVLLGGTAELSPIFYLLQRGAKVLTTHVRNIDRVIQQAGEFCGELHYCPQGMDLLTQPSEIAATIRAFSEGSPVHIGIFAYRGGKGRELRLTAAADAIVREVKDITKSLAFYLSPSVTAEISKDTAQRALDTQKPLKVAQRSLHKATRKRWYSDAVFAKDDRFWAQTVCNFQGCSYAASNIFGKYYPAEVYQKDMNVSANVGGITATSSMKTPFLLAAFRQARKFNIEIFESHEMREFLQALWLHDILNPQENVISKQIHGGAFTVPWSLDGCVEEAAITGNIKRYLLLGKNDNMRRWLQKLKGGISQQVVYVSSPMVLEKIIASLEGAFARAFVGGKRAKPAMHLFLGKARVIPKKIAKVMPLLARTHRMPVLGKQVYKWSRSKKIYGNLLTNMLWMQYKKEDRISLSTNTNGELIRIRVHKLNGQDLELSWHDDNVVRQTMYFGRSLQDQTQSLSLDFRYDPQQGNLTSIGPTQVNASAVSSSISLKPFSLNRHILDEYTRLVQLPAQHSIAFPANSGILLEAMDILKSPQWQVDFARVTVFHLDFVSLKKKELSETAVLDAEIVPTELKQTDKGQIFTTTIKICEKGDCFYQAKISLLVRGNITGEKEQKIPRIYYRESYEKKIEITTMGDRDLVDFATLNGDYNPLHQIDSTAQIVGFKRRINPGLGTLAQIESCIAREWQQKVTKLSGTIVRPAYPNKTYFLLACKSPEGWGYQMVDASQKVLIDGSFQLEGEKPS